MSVSTEPPITLSMMRESLYSAVVCDALDSIGLPRQSPRIYLPPMTVDAVLVGRCRTTLWADMAHSDPHPYKLELQAVDACRPDDVLIAAAGGSMRSGIWGELLATAASGGGCVGAIVDGAVRDIRKMKAMSFPVFARGTSPYDSLDRQRVVDIGVRVEIGGVAVHEGDLVVADIDGVVFVPHAVEQEAIRAAWRKVHAESVTRDAIRAGMKAGEVYEKYGVL